MDDPAAVTAERQDLIETLQRLTPDQREALVLVGWLGYSAEEAGRLLGVDPASVRGRIHRARATIRRTLGAADE